MYHVTARGDERRAIFRNDADRDHFLHVPRESVASFEVRLNLFCLMTNHIHLVVETPRANLRRFMHRFQTAYMVHFNRRHRRSGHLMQGRYGARLVEKDTYLLRLSRYVHLNPVFTAAARGRPVAERVALLRRYPWSSCRCYIGAARPLDYVERGPVLGMVEPRPAKQRRAYRCFVEAAFLEAARVSPLCVGSEEFCEKVRTLYRRLCDGKPRQEDIAFRRAPRRLEFRPVSRRDP